MDERVAICQHILETQRDYLRLIHGGKPIEWLETDVTMAQLKTMMILYFSGPVSMGELADTLGTGVSTVTGIIDRLVDHNLVAREEDPRDRRIVVGRLTAQGLQVVERLYLTARDRLNAVLDQLTLEELHLISQANDLLCKAAVQAFPRGNAEIAAPR